jgi:hypothetical protein
MEENRLKPFPEGYDQKLANQLFADTEKLRRKLAFEIDPRRLGVDYNEVLSWFTVKFCHVFTRYYGTMDSGRLKGYIINSLKFFKNRILRFSYSTKAQIYNTIELESNQHLPELLIESEYQEQGLLLSEAMKFLKERLSPDSFRVLQIDLHPPLYIISKLSQLNKNSTTKIPNTLVAEYLGWGNDSDSNKRVTQARKEIKEGIEEAKLFFEKVEV